MGFVKQRRVTKCGLNVTVDLEVFVKLDAISVERRAKLSPIVNEILKLGLKKYDDEKFVEDLKAVKEDDLRIRKVMNAQAASQK